MTKEQSKLGSVNTKELIDELLYRKNTGEDIGCKITIDEPVDENVMTVKKLKEQLSRFSDDTIVMVYDCHFEHLEPCDSVEDYSYNYNKPETGKCFIHFWAK